MNIQQNVITIRTTLLQPNLGDALDQLAQLLSTDPAWRAWRDEVDLHRSNYADIAKKENKGLVREGEFNPQRNKIIIRIIEITNEIALLNNITLPHIESAEIIKKIEKGKKRFPISSAQLGLFFLLLTAGVWAIFQYGGNAKKTVVTPPVTTEISEKIENQDASAQDPAQNTHKSGDAGREAVDNPKKTPPNEPEVPAHCRPDPNCLVLYFNGVTCFSIFKDRTIGQLKSYLLLNETVNKDYMNSRGKCTLEIQGEPMLNEQLPLKDAGLKDNDRVNITCDKKNIIRSPRSLSVRLTGAKFKDPQVFVGDSYAKITSLKADELWVTVSIPFALDSARIYFGDQKTNQVFTSKLSGDTLKVNLSMVNFKKHQIPGVYNPNATTQENNH